MVSAEALYVAIIVVTSHTTLVEGKREKKYSLENEIH